MIEDSPDYYDEACLGAFEKNDSPKRLKRLIGLLDLEKDFAVVDFACGSGKLMEHVAPIVKEYVGVDFAEPFITAANKKKDRMNIRNAKFVCSSTEEFCRNYPEYFDIGFALDVSEHIDDSKWVSALKSIRTSLKQGGRLYLHTPNAEFFLEIMKAKNFILKQIGGHLAVRTPDQNTDLIYKGGFSNVMTILLPHYNNLRYLHPLSFFPVIGKYFKARVFMIAQK